MFVCLMIGKRTSFLIKDSLIRQDLVASLAGQLRWLRVRAPYTGAEGIVGQTSSFSFLRIPVFVDRDTKFVGPIIDD